MNSICIVCIWKILFQTTVKLLSLRLVKKLTEELCYLWPENVVDTFKMKTVGTMHSPSLQTPKEPIAKKRADFRLQLANYLKYEWYVG